MSCLVTYNNKRYSNLATLYENVHNISSEQKTKAVKMLNKFLQTDSADPKDMDSRSIRDFVTNATRRNNRALMPLLQKQGQKIEETSLFFGALSKFIHMGNEAALDSYKYTKGEKFQKEYGEETDFELEGGTVQEKITANYSASQYSQPTQTYYDTKGELTQDPEKASERSPRMIAELADENGTIDPTTVKDLSEASRIIDENGEPVLVFQGSNGQIFTDYKSALKASSRGVVNIGVVSPLANVSFEGNTINGVANSQFISLAAVSASTNTKTVAGFLNNSIRKGTISPNKVMIDGELKYVPAGETDVQRSANAWLAYEDANYQLGHNAMKIDSEGYLTIEEPKGDKMDIINKKGETTEVSFEELKEKFYNEGMKAIESYEDAELLAYTILQEISPILSSDETINETNKRPARSEAELKVMLLGLINKLGIKVMALSDYIESFNVRNGTSISAKALADLANNIIALSDNATITDISEELAHFVLEAYDNQTEIQELLAEVENSQEWADYSNEYYDKYSQEYSGEQLTEMVRKEIMGKMLARKIVDNFNMENEIAPQNLIEKLKLFFDTLVNKVRAMISPEIRTELDSMLNELADLILNEQITQQYDKSLLSGKTAVMWSIEDQRAISALQSSLDVMNSQLVALKNANDPLKVQVSRAQRELIRATATSIRDTGTWMAFKTIAATVGATVTPLKSRFFNLGKGIKKGNKDIKITQEDVQTSLALNSYMDILAELKEIAKTDRAIANEHQRDRFIRDIDGLIADITSIKPQMDIVIEEQMKNTIERNANEYDLPDEFKERMIEEFNREWKDIGWLAEKFGTLEHSSNPVLRMLGKLVNQNYFKARQAFLGFAKPFLEKIENNNFRKSDFQRLIKKDADGNYSMYLQNGRDLVAFDNAKRTEHFNIMKSILIDSLKISGLENMTEAEYYKLVFEGKITGVESLIGEQREIYDKKMFEWRKQNEEMYYTDEFYSTQESIYNSEYVWDHDDTSDGDQNIKRGDTVKIHAVTVDYLRSLSKSKQAIFDKYKDRLTGDIDFTKITEEDRVALERIKVQRAGLKNQYIGEARTLKSGLELRIAKDIEFIDNSYKEAYENDTRILKNRYWESLYELANVTKGTTAQRNRIVLNALEANGGIVFTDAYFEKLAERGETYVQKVEAKLRDSGNNTITKEQLEELRDNLKIRTEMLNMFRSPNDLTNTMYDHMTEVDKNTFREVEDRIQELNDKVRELFESDGEVAPEIISETTLNKAYQVALDNSGKTELDFILEHTSKRGRDMIETFDNVLNNPNSNKMISIALKRHVMQEYGLESLDAAEAFIKSKSTHKEQMLLSYARTRLLPYFKSHAPLGYAELMQKYRDGSGEISILLQNLEGNFNNTRTHNGSVLDYITVSPNYQWFEESNQEHVNPNYDPNYRGGMSQPKLSKYTDHEYFDKYGIDQGQYFRGEEVSPTRNHQDYEMQQELLKIMEEVHSLYGVTETANIYKIPQFSKTSMERMEAMASKKGLQTIGNAMRDLSRTRVDEKGFGEQIEQHEFERQQNAVNIQDISRAKVLPKYGLNNLEEVNDITHDFGYSYSLLLYQAQLYEQKKQTLSEALMLQQVIRKKFGDHMNPEGETSRAVKMYEEFLDHYFYGKNRTRKAEVNIGGVTIDIAKIAKFFDMSIVRKVNIGLSPAIAATSGVTAELWLRLESGVGEYIHLDNLAWADAEFARLTPGYASEYAKVNNTSKLYALMEAFGTKDVSERTQNAGYNRVIRAGNDFIYKMLEFADYPIAARVVLSLMDNNRLIGERIVDYNAFKGLAENQGKSSKDLKAEWKTHRENSFYNIVEIKDGVVQIKEEYIDRFENKEQANEYLNKQMELLQNKITAMNNYVDGTLSNDDKMSASRDFLLNFATAHRGWIVTAFQRTFKKSGFNYRTGQFEEGHARTIGNFLNNTIISLRTQDHIDVMNAIRENWEELDSVQRRNIYRVLMHTGLFASMLIAGIALTNVLDDDEPDPWLLEYAGYIYFRTINEVGSMHPVVGLTEVIDMAQTPFMALNNVKAFADLDNYSFDKVSSGKYKGKSKLYQLISKQTFMRHYYDTKDVKLTSRGYRHFNKETLFWLGN